MPDWRSRRGGNLDGEKLGAEFKESIEDVIKLEVGP